MPEWRHIDYAGHDPDKQVIHVLQKHGIAGDKYDGIFQDTIFIVTPCLFQVKRGPHYGPMYERDGTELPVPGKWSLVGDYCADFSRLAELVKGIPDERGGVGLATEVYPPDSPKGRVFAILDQIFKSLWPSERVM